MTEKNLKLIGDGAEITLIDGELSNFEKALEEIMKDAMGLVGDYISPLYIKERAEYLRKQMIKEIEDEGKCVIIDDFVNIPSEMSELGFNHIFPDNEAEIIKKLGLKDGDEVTVQIRKKEV